MAVTRFKKAISAALISSFAFSCTAGASYYISEPLPTVPENVIEYKAYDTETAQKIADETEAMLFANDSEDKIKQNFLKIINEYSAASDAYVKAQLASDKIFSEESNNAVVESMKSAEKVYQIYCKLIESICQTKYKTVLEQIFGEKELEKLLLEIPDERYYKLSAQDEKLVADYASNYGNADVCAEIFIELVNVRKRTAKLMGYDSFVDYANEAIYNRDYSSEEIKTLSDAAAKYFAPLAYNLLKITYFLPNNYTQGDDGELINNIGKAINGIDPELKETYDYMINNKLYDISDSDIKSISAGSYTVKLQQPGVPYLFVSEKNKNGSKTKSIIHEFGHFSAIIHTPGGQDSYKLNNIFESKTGDELNTSLNELIGTKDVYFGELSSSIDTCETQSQGLEALAMKSYGHLFGDSAASEEYSQIYNQIQALLDGCMLNEWQERVYNEDDITADKADNIFIEMIKKYSSEYYDDLIVYLKQVTDGSDNEVNVALKKYARDAWTSVPHTFRAPMYYISYAVSAAAVLDMYTKSFGDYSAAVDNYMRISANGVYAPFKETIANADIENIFDENVIKNIVDKLSSRYAVSYTDVSLDEWYAPYVYQTSNILQGKTNIEFAPQKPITREEFVVMLGKLYHYYTGDIPQYTLNFKDVDASNDDAKYIAWASNFGIVTGYSDAEFGGSDDITREQMVSIMYRLYQYTKNADKFPESGIYVFRDYNEISEWAYEAVSWAFINNIIQGDEMVTLNPKGNTTRAEAAKIAAGYIELAY